MPHLTWAPSARRDLQRLQRFLADRNPDAARRAVQEIQHSLGLIRMHPAAGRPIPGMADGFREWVIAFGGSAYVAAYRVDGGTVVILAIRHGREAGY